MDTTTMTYYRNESNITDKNSTYRHEVPVQYLYVVCIIGFSGITGNILTLAVLLKKRKWTSVNFLIGVMSFSDLCAILTILSVPFQVLLSQRLQSLGYYLKDIFVLSSSLSAMIIGCERAFAVRKPLKFREKWNTKLTVKMYIISSLVCMLLIGVRGVLQEIVDKYFFKKSVYIPYFSVTRVVPFVIILVTNILMILGLIESQRQMETMNSHDIEKETMRSVASITKTVVAITTVYFICMIPSRLTVGLEHAGAFVDRKRISFIIGNTLEVFNCSINFVIYCVTSKFFRKEYKNFLCTCKCKCRRMPESSST